MEIRDRRRKVVRGTAQMVLDPEGARTMAGQVTRSKSTMAVILKISIITFKPYCILLRITRLTYRVQ